MASINQPFCGVNAEPDAYVDAGPACDAVQLHGLKELTRRELLILLLDVHDAASASDDADSIESTVIHNRGWS